MHLPFHSSAGHPSPHGTLMGRELYAAEWKIGTRPGTMITLSFRDDRRIFGKPHEACTCEARLPPEDRYGRVSSVS